MVEVIDEKAHFLISIGMVSVHCKVLSDKKAKARLEFFAPDSKRRCKVMTMGALNHSITFVEIMIKIHLSGMFWTSIDS